MHAPIQLQQTNWTSTIGGLAETGINQIIAHIKLASFQVALHHNIKVNPRAGEKAAFEIIVLFVVLTIALTCTFWKPLQKCHIDVELFKPIF